MRTVSAVQQIVKTLLILIVLVFGIVVLIKLNFIEINKFTLPNLVPKVLSMIIVTPQNESSSCEIFARALRQFGISARCSFVVPYNPDTDIVLLYHYLVINDMEFQSLLKYAENGGVVIFSKGSGIANYDKNNSIKYTGLGAYLAAEQGINPSIHFDYIIEKTPNGTKPTEIFAYARIIRNEKYFGRCNHELILNETIYDFTVLGTDVVAFNVLQTSHGDRPAILLQKYGRGYLVLIPYDIKKDICSLLIIIRYSCANKLFLAQFGL